MSTLRAECGGCGASGPHVDVTGDVIATIREADRLALAAGFYRIEGVGLFCESCARERGMPRRRRWATGADAHANSGGLVGEGASPEYLRILRGLLVDTIAEIDRALPPRPGS